LLTEIPIIGDISKVATVGVKLITGLLVAGQKTMVCPLPHKTALKLRVLVKDVDILLNVSRTITHGMYVLAKDQRLCIALVFGELDDLLNGRIHPRVHIHCLGIYIGFVVDGSTVIIRLDPIVHGLEVFPEESLVTKGPDND
jgi:hypothetical protein